MSVMASFLNLQLKPYDSRKNSTPNRVPIIHEYHPSGRNRLGFAGLGRPAEEKHLLIIRNIGGSNQIMMASSEYRSCCCDLNMTNPAQTVAAMKVLIGTLQYMATRNS